jgi:hypothetical protein
MSVTMALPDFTSLGANAKFHPMPVMTGGLQLFGVLAYNVNHLTDWAVQRAIVAVNSPGVC